MSGRFQIILSIGVCLAFVAITLAGRDTERETYTDIPFLQTDAAWADSLLETMDLDQKVGQLMLIQYAAAESAQMDSVLTDPVTQGHIGGFVFQKYTPEGQVRSAHRYQRLSPLPLWIAVENASSSIEYSQVPNDLTLAAVSNDSLISELGFAIGLQSRQLGIHLQFTPTLAHSYTHNNRERTIHKLLRVHRGIQDHRVLSCAEHVSLDFAAGIDSLQRDSLLYPYRQMVRSGISGFVLEPGSAYGPAATQTGTHLHQRLHFNGILFAPIADSSTQVSTYVRESISRGVDVFIVHNQFPLVAGTLREMVRDHELSWEELDHKVKKVLLAKAWSQAPVQHRFAQQHELPLRPNSALSLANRSLNRQAITLVKNDKKRIPLNPEGRKPLLLTVGKALPDLEELLQMYAPIEFETITREPYRPLRRLNVAALSAHAPLIVTFSHTPVDVVADIEFLQSLRELEKRTELILVNLGDPQWLAPFTAHSSLVQAYNDAPLTQQLLAQALFGGEAIEGQLPVSVSQTLAYGQGIPTDRLRLNYTYPEAAGMSTDSLLRIDEIALEGIAQGAMPGCQVLVVKSGQVVYHKSFGYHTYDQRRAVKSTDLYDLASLTKVAATTLAAMELYDAGKMQLEDPLASFFQNRKVKTYPRVLRDTLAPDSLAPSPLELLTDSSVAYRSQPEPSLFIKTANTARTEDRKGKAEIPDTVQSEKTTGPLAAPSPIERQAVRKGVWQESPIFRANMAELLTHKSGLPAAMPILPYLSYRDSLTGRFDRYFQETPDSLFSIQVADHFYLRNDYRDSIWQSTKRLRVYRKDYEYSDVNMVLVQQAIDSINRMSIDRFLDSVLYRPLGLSTIRFNPRKTLDKDRLVPTEVDRSWRGQTLQGFVHDPTAALMGGISGNAGLFSNANDLAILFQMILNGGQYGGRQYLKPATVRQFTSAHQGHRGLGFDKPPQSGGYIIGDQAPRSSYGHTGFTGTCVWVDPENELVYIFLSNRVHPSAKNWRINTLRIRQRIHDAIYQSLETVGGILL